AGDTVKDNKGAMVSRLIVTDRVVVPPADDAVHVNVTPAVSVVTLLAEQPVLELMLDSASLTVHVTCPLLRYQPLLPAVPETLDGTTGGVVSTGGAVRPETRNTRS